MLNEVCENFIKTLKNLAKLSFSLFPEEPCKYKYLMKSLNTDFKRIWIKDHATFYVGTFVDF